MRLWHYKLLPYLPDSQLVSQWRELCAIFKSGKEVNHILINYVKEYPKTAMLHYSTLIVDQMSKRGFKVNISKLEAYFEDLTDWFKVAFFNDENTNPFPTHHNDRYLLQCFFNLQEKYDRGQKDFSKERYERMAQFVKSVVKKEENIPLTAKTNGKKEDSN